MTLIDEARDAMERAKAVYWRTLRAADSKLKAAVSQDPSQIEAAKALQAEYMTGYTPVELKGNTQPAGPAVPLVEMNVTDGTVVFKNGASATHIFKGEGVAYSGAAGWAAYDAEDDKKIIDGVGDGGEPVKQ